MRNLVLTCLALLTLSAVLYAEDSFDGAWRTEAPGQNGTDVITMEFKTDGTKLTGTIKRSQGQATALEGKIDQDLAVFVITIGSKTITFLGKIRGDQIEFTRDARGTAGPQDGPGTGIFGMNGPKTLTATRLKTAATPPASGAPTSARPTATASVDLGTWQIQVPGSNGPEILVIDFKTDGTKLAGGIRRIAPCCSEAAALDGMINKDLMLFFVQNGGQTVAFMGKLAGNEIAFTRETTGTPMPGAVPGVLGANLPTALTAKRVR